MMAINPKAMDIQAIIFETFFFFGIFLLKIKQTYKTCGNQA